MPTAESTRPFAVITCRALPSGVAVPDVALAVTVRGERVDLAEVIEAELGLGTDASCAGERLTTGLHKA
jgi:hypothetical protein